MERMSLEQLKSLKEQFDLEVNLLQDSLNNIRTATNRLEIASPSLHQLSLRPQGKKMLVPLIASLYVRSLDDSDNVLVDIGTEYFVERHIYGLQGKNIEIFAERSSWALNPYYVRSWLNLLSHTPRVAPFLSKNDPLVMALKQELADHTDEVYKEALSLIELCRGQLKVVQLTISDKDNVSQLVVSYFMGLVPNNVKGFVKLKDQVTNSEKWFTTSEIEGSPAVKLNLSLTKPIILMPRRTGSPDYLKLDVVHITVQNSFQWFGGGKNEINVVHLETLAIMVDDINLSVGTGSELGESIIKDMKGVCQEIKKENYITVVDASTLIGDISGLADKIQSFFMQEVFSETHSVLKTTLLEYSRNIFKVDK